jgi:hypothetical protein
MLLSGEEDTRRKCPRSYVLQKVKYSKCIERGRRTSISLLTWIFWKHRKKEEKRQSKEAVSSGISSSVTADIFSEKCLNSAARNSPTDVGLSYWPRHRISLHIARLSNIPAVYSNPFAHHQKLPSSSISLYHSHPHTHIHIPGGTYNSLPTPPPKTEKLGFNFHEIRKKREEKWYFSGGFMWRVQDEVPTSILHVIPITLDRDKLSTFLILCLFVQNLHVK